MYFHFSENFRQQFVSTAVLYFFSLFLFLYPVFSRTRPCVSRPEEAHRLAHVLRRPLQYMAQYGVRSIQTEVFVDSLAPLALPRRTSAIARIRWRNPGHTIGLPFSHDPPLGRMACALRTDLAVHARRIAYHQPQLVATF